MVVVKCADFNVEEFFNKAPRVKNRRGNPGRKIRKYVGITTAFDIETSVIPGTEQAVMYIWQWCFNDVVVIGRTWDEFLELMNRIRRSLPEQSWMVVYVHNLSHEFQYLKGIYSFTENDVFAVGSRQVVKLYHKIIVKSIKSGQPITLFSVENFDEISHWNKLC